MEEIIIGMLQKFLRVLLVCCIIGCTNTPDLNITDTTPSETAGVPIAVNDATFDTTVLGATVPIVVEFKVDW